MQRGLEGAELGGELLVLTLEGLEVEEGGGGGEGVAVVKVEVAAVAAAVAVAVAVAEAAAASAVVSATLRRGAATCPATEP